VDDRIFSVIDFISIIPFYLERAIVTTNAYYLAIFRILRLARLFRLMKIMKYLNEIPVALRAYEREKLVTGVGFMCVVIVLVLTSSALFYAEALLGMTFDDELQQFFYHDGSLSKFQGLPVSLWWGIVTMTTVGYGDFFPQTSLGKAVAGVTAVVGILVIAFPFSILGNAYGIESSRARGKRSIIARREEIKADSKGGGVEMFEPDLLAEGAVQVTDCSNRAEKLCKKADKLASKITELANHYKNLIDQLDFERKQQYFEFYDLEKMIRKNVQPPKREVDLNSTEQSISM